MQGEAVTIAEVSPDQVLSQKEHQANLGQFMTPEVIANFMASWLTPRNWKTAHVLDAGAGKGALSKALATSWDSQGHDLQGMSLTLFEKDADMVEALRLELPEGTFGNIFLHEDDYILRSAQSSDFELYTHAILNPPYKKISSKSDHRLALRQCGIETGNLYSAFVALALQQLCPMGQLVAIIPRSFCNGPYFKPFRKQILAEAALTHIHLFESRTHAFQSDGVLQENIIIRLEKAVAQGEVVVSTSAEADFQHKTEDRYPFEEIVHPSDDDSFIRIPSSPESVQAICPNVDVRVGLEDINAQVSTGPVVGFRLREFLRDEAGDGAVPLVYPVHLRGGRVRWPLLDGDKANAIFVSDETKKWLLPNGCYCVVRRFSSKEERHRIVASVIEDTDFDGSELIGLDNKLNVFHFKKQGLDLHFVHGLAAYLNTDLVDQEFRIFSGHTQVNATDLRKMKYPRKELLIALGEKIVSGDQLDQDQIYNLLEI